MTEEMMTTVFEWALVSLAASGAGAVVFGLVLLAVLAAREVFK